MAQILPLNFSLPWGSRVIGGGRRVSGLFLVEGFVGKVVIGVDGIPRIDANYYLARARNTCVTLSGALS